MWIDWFYRELKDIIILFNYASLTLFFLFFVTLFFRRSVGIAEETNVVMKMEGIIGKTDNTIFSPSSGMGDVIREVEGVVGGEGVAELKQILSPREFLLSKVEHPKLSRIIDQLYRPTAKYGSGSTADAVRHELQAGQLLPKTGHIQKSLESRNALTELINSGKLNL